MLPTLVVRTIQRNFTQSMKAVNGMGFTIAIVVCLLSLINGLSVEVGGLVLQTGEANGLVVQHKDGTPFSVADLTGLPQESIAALVPKYEAFASVQHLGVEFQALTVVLNVSTYVQHHPNSYVTQGQGPSNSSEVLVGTYLADSLNVSVGSSLVVGSTPVTVVGVLHDESGYLNGVLFHKDFSEEATHLEVVLHNPAHSDLVAKNLRSYWGEDYVVRPTKENQSFLASVVDEMISKFSFVVLVVGLLSAMRMYYYTAWVILNHFNDFLVLRICGFRRYQLLLLVLSLVLVVGNSAILLGVTIGVALPVTLAGIAAAVVGIQYLAFFPPVGFLVFTGVVLNIAVVLGAVRPIIELVNSPLVVQQLGRG